MFEKSAISVMQNQTKVSKETKVEKARKYRKMTQTVAIEWKMWPSELF